MSTARPDFPHGTVVSARAASPRATPPSTVVRRSADKNLPPHPSLSPAIPAARGGGEGTSESADRLTRFREVDDTSHLYEQLRSLATQPMGRTAILGALFDVQLARAGVVACAAYVRRNDGSLAQGITKSRLSKRDFAPLTHWLADTCAKSISGAQRSTYTAGSGIGAICVPIHGGPIAALATVVRHGDDLQWRATEMAVAQLVAAHFDGWKDRQHLADTSGQLADSAAIVELVQRVERSSGVTSACFAIADALKDHLGCERVVVGLKHDRPTCRIEAVSGMADIDAQSDESRRMRAALDECLVRNELGAWPPVPSSLAGNQISKSAPRTNGLHQLLAHKKLAGRDSCVISTPLRASDGEPMGALLVIARRALASVPQSRCLADSLSEPLGSALSVVRRAEGSRVRRIADAVFAPRHAKKRWITTALLLTTFVAMMIPMPYRVACRSIAEPVERRFCVAPHDGLLNSTLAEPGDMVARGRLLARMDGREVRWELAGITADIGRAAKRRDTHMARHETPDALLAELEMKRLESRSQLLRFREQNLEIVSPIDGMVLSGSLDRRENYPVTKGQVLYEVAPLDALRVEMSVPADDVTHVEAGMAVALSFDGLGGQGFEGRLSKIRPRSEIREDDNVFIAEAVIDNTDRRLRPGMRGRAKIVSRQRPICWIVFHRAFEKMRTAWPW